jgi:acetyl-CoA carboxylase biotin carboxylase subunit
LFKKILIANRGEIAMRVIVACRELGIKTVAVYSEADENSLHLRFADEDVCIGPAKSSESYLNVPHVISAAEITGADAIHPGYGFLAESAYLAEVCEACHIKFIGPDPNAIRLMGDKSRARRAMKKAGLPILPGSDGPIDTEEQAAKVAREIGYPVIIKATAGGGGRGMRVVRDAAGLEESLAAAQREAELGFGDPTVFCERLLERPRHVEVQILADADTVHVLGLRDCSVQRRHQKVVEESPPPRLDDHTRLSLRTAASAFAAAIGYRNAGTAEFLVDGDTAFFLELNGRIQVEHPVTEAVTGLDIVELQLRVAGGETLALGSVAEHGHAIEARVYAEDPVTFLPQPGTITRLRLPGDVRVDSGVEEGDEIGTSYDPMIAKLIAHGPTREDAPECLGSALAEMEVGGLTTNLPFLRWLVGHPAFRAAELSTAFLIDHPPLSTAPLRLPQGPFRGAWRLNLPSPPPVAPPAVGSTSHAAPTRCAMNHVDEYKIALSENGRFPRCAENRRSRLTSIFDNVCSLGVK